MKLYPYQELGAYFLAARKRAYLADTMGLGKTAQAITAAQNLGLADVAIICPASAVENWRAEWSKWEGSGHPRTMSYNRLVNCQPIRTPELVILDEAHYAKSVSAKRTKAALRLAAQAPYAWLLSGTPMPNHPGELWAPIKYLWPEVAEYCSCKTYNDWLQKFCKCRMTDWGLKPYAVQNGFFLRETLKPILLRRRIEDVGIELPPLRVDVVPLPKTATAEKELKKYENADAQETYVSTLRRILGGLKAKPIADQISEELYDRAYDKIVILYYHKDVGHALADILECYGTAGFDGSTPQKERAAQIEMFQTDRNVRVFLAQQQSAGVAINLTAASEIVLVEPAWSPEDNAQAIARIHRIGQDVPCRARIFTLAGTIDSAIMAACAGKTKMQKEVLSAGEV